MLGLRICMNCAGRRGLGMHDSGREEIGADGIAQAPERRLRRGLRAQFRRPHCHLPRARRAAHLRRERAEMALRFDRQPVFGVQRSVCLRHQLHGDHRVGWRAGRRPAVLARLLLSEQQGRATPPTGRSAASVLASVKGEARQGAPAAPPLTFAAHAGDAETGRDGRMAVPGPNNRMAGKMHGTVIGAARREARAA